MMHTKILQVLGALLRDWKRIPVVSLRQAVLLFLHQRTVQTPPVFISIHGYQLYKSWTQHKTRTGSAWQWQELTFCWCILFSFWNIDMVSHGQKNPTVVKHSTTTGCGNVCLKGQTGASVQKQRSIEPGRFSVDRDMKGKSQNHAKTSTLKHIQPFNLQQNMRATKGSI